MCCPAGVFISPKYDIFALQPFFQYNIFSPKTSENFHFSPVFPPLPRMLLTLLHIANMLTISEVILFKTKTVLRLLELIRQYRLLLTYCILPMCWLSLRPFYPRQRQFWDGRTNLARNADCCWLYCILPMCWLSLSPFYPRQKQFWDCWTNLAI